jgi:hypothetical protein
MENVVEFDNVGVLEFFEEGYFTDSGTWDAFFFIVEADPF